MTDESIDVPALRQKLEEHSKEKGETEIVDIGPTSTICEIILSTDPKFSIKHRLSNFSGRIGKVQHAEEKKIGRAHV